MKKIVNKSGFTLVEIMIVVTIIALLAAFAIPNFIKARNRTSDSRCVNNFRQIASAIEQVISEQNLDATGVGAIPWNAAPAAGQWGAIGILSYLKVVPTCTFGGVYTAVGGPNGEIQMTCSGTNHSPSAIYNSGGGTYWEMR